MRRLLAISISVGFMTYSAYAQLLYGTPLGQGSTAPPNPSSTGSVYYNAQDIGSAATSPSPQSLNGLSHPLNGVSRPSNSGTGSGPERPEGPLR